MRCNIPSRQIVTISATYKDKPPNLPEMLCRLTSSNTSSNQTHPEQIIALPYNADRTLGGAYLHLSEFRTLHTFPRETSHTHTRTQTNNTMGVSVEKKSGLRLGRLFRGIAKQSSSSNSSNGKSVSFHREETVYSDPSLCWSYEERSAMYPELDEKQTLQEFRRQIMTGYLKGSAGFKDSVEKLYAGARKNYDEEQLSSAEFSLEFSNQDRDDQQVYNMVASEIRGLEEMYCSVITDHRSWAITKVVESQREKTLRKKLHSVAATVSTRSKNFARLVALGDAEEAKKVYAESF
eukprot:scaffold7808_cov184-Amphora_coffeaeformis.AAC.23